MHEFNFSFSPVNPSCVNFIISPATRVSQVDNGKELACQIKRCKRRKFDPWTGKTLWRRKWQPTPVFLPGESQVQRSLAGYSPQDRTESDTAETT